VLDVPFLFDQDYESSASATLGRSVKQMSVVFLTVISKDMLDMGSSKYRLDTDQRDSAQPVEAGPFRLLVPSAYYLHYPSPFPSDQSDHRGNNMTKTDNSSTLSSSARCCIPELLPPATCDLRPATRDLRLGWASQYQNF